MTSLITRDILSDIESIASDNTLYEEARFSARADAIDTLEFHVLDRIEGLLQEGQLPEGLIELRQRAEQLKQHFEAIDQRLFQRLRAEIR